MLFGSWLDDCFCMNLERRMAEALCLPRCEGCWSCNSEAISVKHRHLHGQLVQQQMFLKGVSARWMFSHPPGDPPGLNV